MYNLKDILKLLHYGCPNKESLMEISVWYFFSSHNPFEIKLDSQNRSLKYDIVNFLTKVYSTCFVLMQTGCLLDFLILLSSDTFSQGEPRVLGLAMIPGHHVVSIEVEADSLEDVPGFGASH